MPNRDPEIPSRQSHIEAQNVEFYKWRLQLFSENRMTHDKTLLQLSSAGIGLVITLFAAFKKFDPFSGALFLFSALSLGSVIILVLKTFKLNALAVRMEEGAELDKLNRKMGRFDFASETLFIVAGVVLFCSSVSLFYHQPANEGETMSSNENSSNKNRQVDGTGINKNSLEGFGGMKPNIPPEKPSTTQTGSGSGQESKQTTTNKSGEKK